MEFLSVAAFAFSTAFLLAQPEDPPRMQSPKAHMAAQGARLRIKGAAPTAISQSQLNAAPPPIAAKPVIISICRLEGLEIALAALISFEVWVISGIVLLG